MQGFVLNGTQFGFGIAVQSASAQAVSLGDLTFCDDVFSKSLDGWFLVHMLAGFRFVLTSYAGSQNCDIFL